MSDEPFYTPGLKPTATPRRRVPSEPLCELRKNHVTWIWNHTYDVDAEDQLDQILKLEKAPSELATTDAPYDEERLNHWQQRVFRLHGLKSQNA
jgi:hypothetical protein